MIVEPSSYRSPWYLPGADLQSIIPQVARNSANIEYRRERIDTPDGDFLDLDWSEVGGTKVAILAHGMEGNSRRPYMLGMVNAFNRAGWDALAWNMRGCSEEPNRQPAFYHAGLTGDLEIVVARVLARQIYESLVLIGFSLGGNLILKYLGERGTAVPKPLVASVNFSVPLDLADGAEQLHRRRNALYLHHFLRRFRAKIEKKAALIPNVISTEGFKQIRDLRDFDAYYTVRLHGFSSVDEYWCENSCLPFLPGIAIPSLIVNGRNDSFLGAKCYPVDLVAGLEQVYLEIPAGGGHVGFPAGGDRYWSEERAVEFVSGI